MPPAVAPVSGVEITIVVAGDREDRRLVAVVWVKELRTVVGLPSVPVDKVTQAVEEAHRLLARELGRHRRGHRALGIGLPKPPVSPTQWKRSAPARSIASICAISCW